MKKKHLLAAVMASAMAASVLALRHPQTAAKKLPFASFPGKLTTRI